MDFLDHWIILNWKLDAWNLYEPQKLPCPLQTTICNKTLNTKEVILKDFCKLTILRPLEKEDEFSTFFSYSYFKTEIYGIFSKQVYTLFLMVSHTNSNILYTHLKGVLYH